MYPYLYKLSLLNELTYETETVKGITFGETYSEAVERLEDYYGGEIIAIEYFMRLEDSPVEITDECYEYIQKL